MLPLPLWERVGVRGTPEVEVLPLSPLVDPRSPSKRQRRDGTHTIRQAGRVT